MVDSDEDVIVGSPPPSSSADVESISASNGCGILFASFYPGGIKKKQEAEAGGESKSDSTLSKSGLPIPREGAHWRSKSASDRATHKDRDQKVRRKSDKLGRA